ncbi:MAG: sigma-54 dependent transcriptional regulator [Blastocatellia bacterium]
MQILVVDDDRAIRDLVRSTLREEGFDVTVAADGETAIEMGRRLPFDLVFCDVKMGSGADFDVLRAFRDEVQTSADIILMTGHASLESAMDAVRGGARDYIVKPFSVAELSNLARSAMERRRLVRAASKATESESGYPDLIGKSPAMNEVFRNIERISMTDLAVLISGESGTEKEAVARTIHARSPRASQPFVAVNCGALPEGLLERELFGYSRGAFPGAASDRRGLFEEAAGGTLLLDEITELSPGFQAKLVAVLQEGEVRRVGSSVPSRLDVRLMTTANRDPEVLVATGLFREDLMHRISMVSFRLPPLRERSGDIDLLIPSLLARYRPVTMPALRVSPEAFVCMRAYSWPGNVREMRHAMQRIATTASGNIVRLADLPDKIRTATGELDELLHEMPSQDVVGAAWTAKASVPARDTNHPDAAWLPLGEIERRYLVRVLYHTRGNKKRAAEILGVDRKTLSRMVERHTINVGRIKRDVRGLR